MKRRLPGLGLFFLAGILCASPVLGQDAPGPSGRNRYSITGAVRDADTNQAAPDTLVELRQFDGPIIEQAYTSGNGNFAFSNLRQDTYELTIDRDGYEHFDQEITPTANVTLNVELQRSRGAAAPAGGNVVSARELSVPHKAHDAMEKGLALLYQKMDYPGSVEQFQRAIREYADYYEAYAQMGVAYVKMGDADQAEQSLRKSLSISGDHYVDAFFILSTILSDTKRFAEAEPLARKAVELDPGVWQAQLQLARAEYGLDNLDDALQNANQAINLKPDHAETYLVLANIHSKTHDYAKLLEDLNNYLRLEPTGPQATQARQTRDELVQQARDTGPAGASPTDSGTGPQN